MEDGRNKVGNTEGGAVENSEGCSAGYTSGLMLPHKAIFSSQAPGPLCRRAR